MQTCVKRFFLLCLSGIVLSALTPVYAANVSITMNTISTTMTLTDADETVVEHDDTSVVSGQRTYVFNNLPAGNYTLSGYNATGVLNGTLGITVGSEDLTLQIWTITKICATNQNGGIDWVYGTDYTIEQLEVHSREGDIYPVSMGMNAGYPSCLVYDGGSVILRLVPSAARADEGYITANDGRTVTANTNIQAAIPMGGTFTVSCPQDAEIAIMQKPGGDGGSGTIHFVPFTLIEPKAVATSGGKKTYTYRLGNGSKYNMRSWKEGGLTQLLTFYYSATPANCPVLDFSEADYAVHSPKWIDHDPGSLEGMNDCNILLNINEKNYLNLRTGQEYDLLAERVWQIIPDMSTNYFLQPDYHYAVYDLDGTPDNSVVEIVPDGNIGSEWAILRAKSAGTAIVTVTYDAASASQYKSDAPTERQDYYGGRYFSALWPENTGVFIVSVDASPNTIKPDMRINEEYNLSTLKNAGMYVDAEHDVFYYINEDEYCPYTFKPVNVHTVEVAYPTLRDNDAVYNTGWHTVAANADGSYTLQLRHGRQIIRLGDGAGNYEYQVLSARHATREIINETTGSTTVFQPGDAIRVQYSGLFHPANKLSGIYNMSAYITYNDNPAGTSLILSGNQYQFGSAPSAQAVGFSVPNDYSAATLEMTRGVLQVTGYGDPIGNHRLIGKVGGRSPNFTAVAHQTYFGALPDIVIPITQLAQTRAEIHVVPAAATFTVTDKFGSERTADADGKYTLLEGKCTIVAQCTGYKRTPLYVDIPAYCAPDTVINIVLEAVPENGWDGESKTPVTPEDGIYHIHNGAELAWLAAQVNSGTGKSYSAVLDNDIDLCGYDWTPVGYSTNKSFAGTFDGQNHTVDNLFINTDQPTQGLFGALSAGAHVSNITIRGNITSSYDNTFGSRLGGLAGTASGTKANQVYISNITNYVNMTGRAHHAGGIVGYVNQYVNFDRCANYGNILIANENPEMANNAAGIAYLNSDKNVITNSYNCGNIIANNKVGGIYVSTVNATVTNVYNTGYVHATRTNSSGYSCHGAIRPTITTTALTNKVTNAYANESFLFNELNTIIITRPEAWSGGEVAYKLGEAFGQQIGVDPLPVIGGMRVYEYELTDGRTVYTNTPYDDYSRQGLTPGKMGTICLPWAAEQTTGAAFYRILYKQMRDGKPYNITLEEVTDLEAGVPYVFIPEDDEMHVYYYESSAVAEAGHFNGLYGTFNQIADGAAGSPGNILENNYIINQNKFRLCGAYCGLAAYRAFIRMDEVAVQGQQNAPAPVPGRRQIVLRSEDDTDTPTGTENDQMVNDKMLNVYDILGRKLNQTDISDPGVYIINGKKVIR